MYVNDLIHSPFSSGKKGEYSWGGSEGSLGLALPSLAPYGEVVSFGQGSDAAAIVVAV